MHFPFKFDERVIESFEISSFFRNVVKIKEAEIMESNLQENNRKIISEVYNTLKKEKLQPFMSSSKQLRMRCNRLRKKDLPVLDKNFKIPDKYKHMDTEPFLRLVQT